MDFSRLLVSPRDSEVPESLPSPQAAGKWLLNNVKFAFNQYYCMRQQKWEHVLRRTALDLMDLINLSSQKGWGYYIIHSPCNESAYRFFEEDSRLEFLSQPIPGVYFYGKPVVFKIIRWWVW